MWRATKAYFRNWKFTLPMTALLAVAGYFAYDYFIPETYRVVILNTNVKRGANTVDAQTPDQYRVNYAPVVDGKVISVKADVFRNTDAWFFFKFNSGTLDAQLNALGRETVVEVRVYGWRVPWFSMFKNIISIREVGRVEQ